MQEIELIPADYFQRLERAQVFPDFARALEIDAGCGDGKFLIDMARHFPERDFLGIERLGGRVNKIVRRAKRLGLTNVRVVCIETAYALGWLLPEACASRVHLLFPDPWPKKRHAGKRVVQASNVAALRRVLVPGGELLFKTDSAAYSAEAVETIGRSALFEQIEWNGAVGFYPSTTFEEHWIEQGCSICAARWRAGSG